MLFGTWVVGAVTVLYLLAAAAYVYQQQYGSALMFFSYCLANMGFFWQTGVFKL